MCRSKEEAIKCTDDLMEALGAKTVADLRKLDGAEIARAAAEGFVPWASVLMEKKLEKMTGEERKSVESFLRDAKGDDS